MRLPSCCMLTALLTACIHSREPSTGAPKQAPPDGNQAFVSLSILAWAPTRKPAYVQSGAKLHTGQQLAFHLWVARPASVYLIEVFPTGRAVLLYPENGKAERLEPQVKHRVPADPTASFVLDDEIGTERVLLIASERPLGSNEQALSYLVEHVKTAGRWPAENARPAAQRKGAPARAEGRRPEAGQDPAQGPGFLSEEHRGPSDQPTRGIRLDPGSSGRALDLQPDAAGIAVATLQFEHLP